MKTLSYFLYLLILFALLPLSCIAPDVNDAIQAESWPTIQGKVLSKKLRESSSREPGRVVVDVDYEYAVDGKQHRGNKAFSLDFQSRGEQNRAILDKLTENGPVIVRYDLADPANSTLGAGLPSKLKGRLVFGFMFLGIGVCWFLMFRMFTMTTNDGWSLVENLHIEERKV